MKLLCHFSENNLPKPVPTNFQILVSLQNSHFANERMTSVYLLLPRESSNATVHSIFAIPREKIHTSY